MTKFKKNIVRPNIFDYNIAIFGQQGVGKTTLAYQVCHKLLGDDYVIFNCGREDGIKALPDAIYYDCPTWDEFDEIITEVIDERTTEYKDLKVVVLDTIDEIFNMAENEVLRLAKKENPTVNTMNKAFGGFGAGLKKAEELVLDALWRLKSVGINVFVIGHTKNKTMVDVVNDGEYDILTSNLSNRYFSEIATKMDVIGICYVDRNIITEKTNRKDIKGKVIERNVVANEARKICFRSDDYVTASKSRFPDIEGVIDLNADDFISTIENSIQKLIDKSTMSKDDIKEHYEKENAEKLKRIAEAEETARIKKELDETKAKIVAFFVENKTNMDAIKPALALCKKYEYSNPNEIDKLEVAKEVLALCR